jgi:hypothetical protein
MSDPRINLFALRQLFLQEEWTALTGIAAFNEAAHNLQSAEDIEKALRLGLDLLERKTPKREIP